MLSYKLTSYLADFKVEKKYSRIDIVFLAVCTVIMFLPMSHINNVRKSETENRNLALWKPLILKNGQINYNFGRDYDSWFNDRFNMRTILVNLNSYFLSDKNEPKVVIGKDGWLFVKMASGIRNFLNLDVFTDTELKKITAYLMAVDNYCRDNNKHFYFFIAPDKSKIYGEYYPDYIKQNIPNNKSRAMQLIRYLEANTNIKIIYPYEELHKSKQFPGYLYRKKDSHWTSLGAYVGYNSLIDALNTDGLKISAVRPEKYVHLKNEKDFDLVKLLNCPRRKSMDETIYLEALVKTEYTLQTKNGRYAHPDEISFSNGLDYDVVMFRDSFTISMIPFISNTFGNVSYYWDYNVMKNAIKDADIVILEIVERELCSLPWKHFK